MTLTLADETVEVTNVAEAYRILREQGVSMRSSDRPPKPSDLAQWRRRVSDLSNMKVSGNPEKDLLHPKLQAVLADLEEDILTKHPVVE